MAKPKFLFGDIVVVNENQIGVIVKSWQSLGKSFHYEFYYEVYNRMTSKIEDYVEERVERYVVRHKYLNEEEIEMQNFGS